MRIEKQIIYVFYKGNSIIFNFELVMFFVSLTEQVMKLLIDAIRTPTLMLFFHTTFILMVSQVDNHKLK